MADRDYQRGEVTARGDAIYRDQILPRLEPMPKGTFVVIDIESGDYEIDGRGCKGTGSGPGPQASRRFRRQMSPPCRPRP